VKEIEETKNIERLTIDHEAIHRNEVTGEKEGGDKLEYISKHRKKVKGSYSTYNTHRVVLKRTDSQNSIISWTSRVSNDD